MENRMTQWAKEITVDGQLWLVEFTWDNYGRTYISESQGGDRTSPVIGNIYEDYESFSFRSGRRTSWRVKYSPDLGGKLPSAPDALIKTLMEVIELWGEAQIEFETQMDET
jgi:hypothetical protein